MKFDRPFLKLVYACAALGFACLLVGIWQWEHRWALTGAAFLVASYFCVAGAILEKR